MLVSALEGAPIPHHSVQGSGQSSIQRNIHKTIIAPYIAAGGNFVLLTTAAGYIVLVWQMISFTREELFEQNGEYYSPYMKLIMNILDNLVDNLLVFNHPHILSKNQKWFFRKRAREYPSSSSVALVILFLKSQRCLQSADIITPPKKLLIFN